MSVKTPMRQSVHVGPLVGVARWLPRPWQRWAVAGFAILLLLLVVFRRPLSDRIWPEASAQALRDRAAKALAHGRLTAADGSGARELYEAALAIDPDANDARTGLMRVAQAALAQASVAIDRGRYADAHRALQLARALSAPQAQVEAAAGRLRQEEARHAGIDRLLQQASDARRAHRLDGSSDAALPIYQRVLAMQPDRVEALEGREDALSDVLQDARLALQRGDLAEGARLVSVARTYDAGHAELPDAQARLSQSVEQANARANRALHERKLEAATEQWQAVLQVDAGNRDANGGLERVASAWAHRAERDAADFRFTDAGQALEQARALGPDPAVMRAAEHAIAHARQSQSRLNPPALNRQRAREVRQLLAEAAAAEKRGDLLSPPGDSAFDKVRAARALAPDDAAVRQEGKRLLPTAIQCFERELRNNNLARAEGCLDARIALDGDRVRIAHDRRRLAERWLAVGDERLGAGDARGATAALERARALDPQAPGIDLFSERLRAAGVR
jgi:tetratricopeptide (TPR) repeat protein